MDIESIMKALINSIMASDPYQPANLLTWRQQIAIADGTTYLPDKYFRSYDFVMRQTILTDTLQHRLIKQQHHGQSIHRPIDNTTLIHTIQAYQRTVPYELSWPTTIQQLDTIEPIINHDLWP